MQLQTLGPEEALEKLHASFASEAHRLRPLKVPWNRIVPHWMGLTVCLSFLWYVASCVRHDDWIDTAIAFLAGLVILLWLGILLLAPIVYIFEFFFNRSRERASEDRTNTLRSILGNCTLTEATPLLLDFLVWLEPVAQPERLRSLHEALVRLLPRMSEAELVQILTPKRRNALRLVCKKHTDIELTRVALLVLASADDHATLAIARRIRRSRPILADAAEAFLDVVR